MPRTTKAISPRASEFGDIVLAAVDLGGDWENVVGHAAAFAARRGARLHLVHVIEEPSGFLQRALRAGDLRAWTARIRGESKERMTGIVAGISRVHDVAISTSIRGGRPAAEIMAEAGRLHAGLVVCGAGVTERSEWLRVGTTPDRILRSSAIPVLVVGPDIVKPFKRILVPTDCDRADQGALRVGARLAAESGGRLTVLHVYAQPSLQHRWMGNLARLRRELHAASRKAFQEFVEGTRLSPRVPAPRRLLVAEDDRVRPAEAIAGEAARLKSDLIVMALGSITILRRLLLGSVAERVIRILPCSLLALPKAWAEKW